MSSTRRIRAYMAGPLFTLAERAFNVQLARALQEVLPHVLCVLPQERCASLPDLPTIALDCFDQVRQCDVLVVNLDGPDADSGTCTELGYGYALGKPIVAFRSDVRDGELEGINSMMHVAASHYVQVNAFKPDAFEQLVHQISQALLSRFPVQQVAEPVAA